MISCRRVCAAIYLLLTLGCSRHEEAATEAPKIPQYKFEMIDQGGGSMRVIRGGSLCIPTIAMSPNPSYAKHATLHLYWPGLASLGHQTAEVPSHPRDVIIVTAWAGNPEVGKARRLIELTCGKMLDTDNPFLKDCERNARVSSQGSRSYFVVGVLDPAIPIEESWVSCSPLKNLPDGYANCRATISGIPGTDYILVDMPERLLPQVGTVYRQLLQYLACPDSEEGGSADAAQ